MSEKRNLTGVSPAEMSAADFAPFLNEIFEMEGQDGAVNPVELVLTHESAHANPYRKGPGFTLIFWAQGEAMRPQGHYRLVHPEAGEIDFLMIPTAPGEAVGKDGNGACYQVIVN